MVDYQQVANALAEARAGIDEENEQEERLTFSGILIDVAEYFERLDPSFSASKFKKEVRRIVAEREAEEMFDSIKLNITVPKPEAA